MVSPAAKEVAEKPRWATAAETAARGAAAAATETARAAVGAEARAREVEANMAATGFSCDWKTDSGWWSVRTGAENG